MPASRELLDELRAAADVAAHADAARAADRNHVRHAPGGAALRRRLRPPPLRPGRPPASDRSTAPAESRRRTACRAAGCRRSPAASLVAVSTSTHRIPATHAAAAVMRAWFDCTAPVVISVVAPCARASATRYSSLRALLPPRPSDGQIVALDQDARAARSPAERVAQAGRVVQRRRQRGERQCAAASRAQRARGDAAAAVAFAWLTPAILLAAASVAHVVPGIGASIDSSRRFAAGEMPAATNAAPAAETWPPLSIGVGVRCDFGP